MILLKVEDGTMNSQKGFNLKEVIIIIIASSILTSMTTGIIVYNQNKLTKNLTYKDLNQDNALKEFLEVYASLIDQYYENVDKEKLLQSAINAMFNYLGEDYSTFMSKEETDSLAQKLLGEYTGIGISLNQNKEIVAFIEGGSAKNSGLQIGDQIIGIDENNTQNMNSNELVDIIKKINIGKNINIKVKRGEQELTFIVENKRLLISSVNSKIIDNNIGYLEISTFSNTLKEQVKKALEDLEQNNINSLIIDLRNNTGGYLSSAKDVACMFLDKGSLIYSLEEKDGIKNYYDDTDEKRDYKIAILLNENSASASEVLIAALKDNEKSITIGTKSYGKGKVQQTHPLDDGSMIKYTSAKWLTPKGICIDEIGITPDYIINNDETIIDNQLNKAIELLK